MGLDQLVGKDPSLYMLLVPCLCAMTSWPKHAAVHVACWSLWLSLLHMTWTQRNVSFSHVFTTHSRVFPAHFFFFPRSFDCLVSSHFVNLAFPVESLLIPSFPFLSHVVQATVPTSLRATAVACPCLPLTSSHSTGEQLFPVLTHTDTHQPAKWVLQGRPAVRAVGLHLEFIISYHTQKSVVWHEN